MLDNKEGKRCNLLGMSQPSCNLPFNSSKWEGWGIERRGRDREKRWAKRVNRQKSEGRRSKSLIEKKKKMHLERKGPGLGVEFGFQTLVPVLGKTLVNTFLK
jgi:hypothetical protein